MTDFEAAVLVLVFVAATVSLAAAITAVSTVLALGHGRFPRPADSPRPHTRRDRPTPARTPHRHRDRRP